MQSLISQDPRAGKARKNTVIEFVRVKRESAIQEKERKLPDKPKKEEPPPPPDLDFSAPDQSAGESMSIAASSTGHRRPKGVRTHPFCWANLN